MKVQLINAPQDYRTNSIESGWYPPLGLLSIATYLKDRGIWAEILDGELLTLEEIIEKIDADIVGIGFSILSSGTMEKIALEAKKKGIEKIIVGGQAATPLYKQLLEENPNIDGVVRYDGEKAMYKLAIGQLDESIDNLAFRTNGTITDNPVDDLDSKDFPILDRSLIALEDYINNFRNDTKNRKEIFDYLRPTSSSLRRGCPNRIGRAKGCSFCARIERVYRTKNPEQAWKEAYYLRKNFDIDGVVDMSDDFIDEHWLEEYNKICKSKEPLDISFRIYGHPSSVNKKVAKLLKEIGVKAVLIGIESGDDEILRNNCEAKSVEKSLNAVKCLAEEGILIADSYVLGMIGETERSLENTVKMFREVQRYGTEITYCSICEPLPGSKVWDKMMEVKSLRDKYSSTYRLNPEELARDYVAKFCSVPFETLREVRKEILTSARFGSFEYME